MSNFPAGFLKTQLLKSKPGADQGEMTKQPSTVCLSCLVTLQTMNALLLSHRYE